jgi:ferredoxin/flavodoxin---NADP+ reductase
VDALKQQVLHFDPAVCLEERVTDVRKLDEQFQITTDKGIHFSKSIIITAGVGSFEPRRLENHETQKFEGKNLHYSISDLKQFTGQRVVVFGGGDSAVDWALMLEEIAKEVTIVHRRDKFRAHEHSIEKLLKSNIRILTSYEIKDIMGEYRIEQLVLSNNKTNEEETLGVDSVIVNFGFISSLGTIKNWGLHLEKGSIVVNSKMETNIPGIYAAGDIASYPGKVKLIAVGFGEAPTAVNNAKAYFDPRAKLQPGHSSSMDMAKDDESKETLKV